MCKTQKTKAMKRFSILIVLGLIFGLVTLNSCQKAQVTDDDTIEATISADQATTDGLNVASTEATTAKETTDGTCYTVERTIDWDNGIGTVVITFNGSTCDDSIYREGTMTIVWDLGWRLNPDGKSMTITYENFVRNDKIFNGSINVSISVDSVALDSTIEIVPVFHITYTDFSITFPDSTQFTISGTKDIRYEGYFDLDRTNNQLVINSQISGTARNGYNFTSVGENITIKAACGFRFPVAGTKTISIEGGKTYLIDFGDGTCDLVYTVTVDGETETRVWGENN